MDERSVIFWQKLYQEQFSWGNLKVAIFQGRGHLLWEVIFGEQLHLGQFSGRQLFRGLENISGRNFPDTDIIRFSFFFFFYMQE